MFSRTSPNDFLAFLLRAWIRVWCIVAFCGNSFAQDALNPLIQLESHLQTLIAEKSPNLVALLVLTNSNAKPLSINAEPFDAITSSMGTGQYPLRFGSGVIMKQVGNDLFILTNAHLIEPALSTSPDSTTKIYIRSASRQTYLATVFASDPRSDLSILKVTATNIENTKPVEFGNADELKRGSLVVALCNPLALARDGQCSSSLGMISNLGRQALAVSQNNTDELIHALGTLLHVDCKLPLGTSGGALFNLNGKFVGLTTSLAAIEGYESNSGFAIPMDAGMQRIVETLLNGYEVEYGFLGMTPDNSLPGELNELRPSMTQPSATRVSRISTNSPAAKAGLEVGDVILSVNQTTVYGKSDLIRELSLLGPSNSADLLVWRNKTRNLDTLTVTLGKWPVYDDTKLVATQQRFEDWRGIRVDYPTARQRYLPDRFLTDYPKGVVVTFIAPNSVASQANLKVGQFIAKVNHQSVETPAEFDATVAKLLETVKLTLLDETVIEILPN